jgi:apolipoprotein N-acyltransferase
MIVSSIAFGTAGLVVFIIFILSAIILWLTLKEKERNNIILGLDIAIFVLAFIIAMYMTIVEVFP